MAKQRISGSVTSAALVFVSVTSLGFVSYTLVPSAGTLHTKPGALATMQRPAVPVAARGWLGVLGMDVDALAAAGVNTESASTVLADLQAYMNNNGEGLIASIDACNAAMKQADEDTRMIRTGRTPLENDTAAHANAFAAAIADRDARRAAAMDAAGTHLSDGQKALLSTIRANAGREVPAAYCVVPRTDAQWVELREALTAERQATERGESPAGSVSSFLATLRADETTAIALRNASMNTAAIRTAVNLQNSPENP